MTSTIVPTQLLKPSYVFSNSSYDIAMMLGDMGSFFILWF
jgi:hypothetical protein